MLKDLIPVIMLVIILGLPGYFVMRYHSLGIRRGRVRRLQRDYDAALDLIEHIRQDALVYTTGDTIGNQLFADLVLGRIVRYYRKKGNSEH